LLTELEQVRARTRGDGEADRSPVAVQRAGDRTVARITECRR
jgi:hypothetical protein